MIRRPPPPALAPYVRCLWYADDTATRSSGTATRRERALPTGGMDLVVRLSDAPIHLYDALGDEVGTSFGAAVLGGARSSYYVRDTTRPARSVGVHFRAGGAAAVLGLPAPTLAERHTPLADLWGARAAGLRDVLLDAGTPDAALDRLAAALPSPRPLHPAVLHALARLSGGNVRVDVVRAETGYSNRRFIELFHQAVGLTPKMYCRVRRFQGALVRLAAGPTPDLTDVALGAGYCDHPHLNRDFRAFAGISPGAYVPQSRDRLNHVPIGPRGSPPAPRSHSSKPAPHRTG
ncbi:MAG: helix-turn-helix domain-containing protein [Myxococcota bacterium]